MPVGSVPGSCRCLRWGDKLDVAFVPGFNLSRIDRCGRGARPPAGPGCSHGGRSYDVPPRGAVEIWDDANDLTSEVFKGQ